MVAPDGFGETEKGWGFCRVVCRRFYHGWGVEGRGRGWKVGGSAGCGGRGARGLEEDCTRARRCATWRGSPTELVGIEMEVVVFNWVVNGNSEFGGQNLEGWGMGSICDRVI